MQREVDFGFGQGTVISATLMYNALVRERTLSSARVINGFEFRLKGRLKARLVLSVLRSLYLRANDRVGSARGRIMKGGVRVSERASA